MSNTITLTASQLHSILALHNVTPTEDFTAEAGKDYGYVAAWELEDGFLVMYGNNGETNYDFADDIDDLPAWLESPDLDGLDTIVQTANVRGADEVEEADEGSEGPFYVLTTSYYYGPTEDSNLVANDDRLQTPREFDTFQDAQDWIDDAEDGIYTLSHNESGAPSYKIVTQ